MELRLIPVKTGSDKNRLPGENQTMKQAEKRSNGHYLQGAEPGASSRWTQAIEDSI
jgi:hypothetical protein